MLKQLNRAAGAPGAWRSEEVPWDCGAAAPLVGGWTGCDAGGSVLLLSRSHATDALIRLLWRVRWILRCY
jgi:hypothetical protein